MLRLAIETADSWIELTESDESGAVQRVRAGTLHDVRRQAQSGNGAVFVDVRVHLAEDHSEAIREYQQANPGWRPGNGGDIVYPGTAAGLAGLVWDTWAAGVADGVTLRSDQELADELVRSVFPILEARGVRFRPSALLTSISA